MKRSLILLIGMTLLVTALAGCASAAKTDIEQIPKAQNIAGQADLSAAAIPVSAYLAENGSLDGFNAAAAAAIEPATKWADGGAATQGVVSIRGAVGDSVVLVTMSASGTPQCLAFSGGAQHQGSTDAQTAAACV
jgi:hypothetical protein